MSRFNTFIKNTTPHNPLLPLAHSCETYNFRSIVEGGVIATSPCDVFAGESLLYFFYGLPAYRPGHNNGAGCRAAIMPTCMLFRPDILAHPKRIAPFDTGAWHRGTLQKYYHPQMQKEHFLLDSDNRAPARLVARFYGDNRSYVRGQPAVFEVPPAEFEVQCYYDMISAQIQSDDDDRRSTIEIQSDHAINVVKGDVLLVVLPGVLLDDPKLRQTIVDDWGATVHGYDLHRGQPKEYMAIIYERVREYLKQASYMS